MLITLPIKQLCCLLIPFVNSLDPDKMWGLIWIQTVLNSDDNTQENFCKKFNLEKISLYKTTCNATQHAKR